MGLLLRKRVKSRHKSILAGGKAMTGHHYRLPERRAAQNPSRADRLGHICPPENSLKSEVLYE